jgi:DNA-binding CsgD family transcriptional regulator
MATPVEQSVVCPVLIGRASNLDAIDRQIDQVANGAGRVALIAGEAGIGKSRLVNEIKSRALQRGLLMLQGGCFEIDRSLPYAPFIDLLRSFFANFSADQIKRFVDPAALDLSRLLPEFYTPQAEASIALDPEQEKRRLFQALSQFLIQLASAQPLLIVIEDLHWCDDTSLELLAFLARRLNSQPVLLLLTYRHDEIDARVNHLLAELDREHIATEFVLKRFAQDEVDAMLRAIFGLKRATRADFLNAIYALTDGNPFFIEEVLKSLIASGDIFYKDGAWDRKPVSELRIPRSVQDAVQRRSNQLSPPAQEILRLASVAGRRFDFSLLLEVTHMDETQLLTIVKQLISAQLVVEESADRFAFRHALTQEAAYATLLKRERKDIHRVVAETLEHLHAPTLEPYWADLAHHFFAAGEWTKALNYSQRVGERAQSLYAPREASEHFSRALSAAEQLNQQRPDLYRARGATFETLGEFDRARDDFDRALQSARILNDRSAEWQALIDLGALWAGRDYAQTGQYYQQAIDLARSIDQPALIAHSLNRLANWYVNSEQPLEGQQLHTEALKIFETAKDQEGVAETLDFLGMANYMGGNLVQGTAYYHRAIDLFRALDNRKGLSSSMGAMSIRAATIQTSTMVAAEKLIDAARGCEEAYQVARDIGWRSGEAFALIMWCTTLGPQGDYTQALDIAHRGIEIAEEIGHLQWMAGGYGILGAIYYDLLALPLARQYLERGLVLGQETGSLHWQRVAAGFLASTLIDLHELSTAESVLKNTLPADSPAHSIGQRLCWCARIELALAQKDPTLALELIDRMTISAPNVIDPLAPNIIRLAILRGGALQQLDRMDEAQKCFDAALTVANEQGNRSLVWRIHLALGKFYQAQARRSDAEREYVAARSLVDELAVNIADESLRDNFLQSAYTLIPIGSPRRSSKQAADGLTPREREVAQHIALGKSNREIADELVVGERTIETHVTNILNKLGFSSRTQIAAWIASKNNKMT